MLLLRQHDLVSSLGRLSLLLLDLFEDGLRLLEIDHVRNELVGISDVASW